MSVTAAEGFVASGTHAGIKDSGALDLSLVATEDGAPVPTAAVFTSNLMTAPPVQVSREHLRANGGRAVAVILNSGNANAATGGPGVADAREMCDRTAAELGCSAQEVLVCSTGVIGQRLPIGLIAGAIPRLAAGRSRDGSTDAAEALRTTDTVRKEAHVATGGFVVGGMAKGAAMLAPDMATMLAVLTTDADTSPPELADALALGVERSFNALTVDGCQSTNDTVVLLASARRGPPSRTALTDAIGQVCEELARQMADDAEGSTKTVRVTVAGAASDLDAARAARRICESALVKCSWYGRDPYWGRIASECGAAGIRFEQSAISVSYGPFEVARNGIAVDHDAADLAEYMERRHLEVTVDLGLGPGTATLLTNDLTHAYVDENMGTS
ncbi:MAG: Arginine biosynthesis bifunctional protein ArgJ [Acidimicrobiales bacterium]|nr:MAG: bifunctional glutamate N-acetyltransferase/amino-acid acetyltransferase ArgJ [Actinomycetota bacterium]MBV6507108.1 Arginine biosynthesis bifunctional protein ArgJ [Acidimicrobiales bacterium]RIK05589.1 MAG: bifunctional ornithine acetyltransferase/N-acetylglutamate synthase [Acidobacteriota bacterium]